MGQEGDMILTFSNPSDPVLGFLSNESRYSLVIDGKKWPTVEHYLQGKKFEGTQLSEDIRNSPTVYRAKSLAKSKGDSKTVQGVSYFVKKDWKRDEPKFLEEAINAKFDQHTKLQEKLLQTYEAKLIDESNPFTGPILERCRERLRNTRSTIYTPYASKNDGSAEKDAKSAELSSQDRKLVDGVIALSKRISVMEGWDGKIFREMIEDAFIILSPNSKTSTQISTYVTNSHNISWVIVIRDMPNTFTLTKNVHQIMIKEDPFQESQLGPSRAIASFVKWFRAEATEQQKSDILEKIKKVKNMKIFLPKVQRTYRRSAPPVIPRAVSTSSKKENKPARKKQKKPKISKSPEERNEIIKEKGIAKKIVNENIDDLETLTTKDVREIMEKRLGHEPLITKAKLTEYLTEVIQDILDKGPSEEIEEEIITTESPESEEIEFKIQKPPAKRKSPKMKIIQTASKKRKDSPEGLIMVNKKDGSFYVWGTLLNKYAPQLLKAGGTYSKKKEGGVTAEIYTAMEFKGKALEVNRIDLLKSINNGGYGGMYKKNKDGTLDKRTIIVSGNSLKTNKDALLKLGGKYLKKSSGSFLHEDTSKINFRDYNDRTEVEKIIFETLPDKEKYITAYRDWVEDKLFDYIDTSVQLLKLKEEDRIISQELIKYVIEEIYDCKLGNVDNLEYEYNDMITSIFRIDGLTSYSITPEGEEELSKHVEKAGNTLISSFEGENYEAFKKALSDMGGVVEKEECEPCATLSSLDSCMLRSVQLTAQKIRKFMSVDLTPKVIERAFLIVVNPNNRLGAKQYFDSLFSEYLDRKSEKSFSVHALNDMFKEYSIRYKYENVEKCFARKADSPKELDVIVAMVICLNFLATVKRDRVFIRRIKLFGS